MRQALLLLICSFLIHAQDKPHKWHWASSSDQLQADAKFVDADKPREIFVSSPGSPDTKELLCTFDRDAEVLFSPDDRWAAVNDFMGSSESEIRIFKRGSGLHFVETKIDPGTCGWSLLRKLHKVDYPKGLTHAYSWVSQWSGDSQAVLVTLQGHEDRWHHVDQWLCVYDLKSGKASLDLSLVNHGSVTKLSHKEEHATRPKSDHH